MSEDEKNPEKKEASQNAETPTSEKESKPSPPPKTKSKKGKSVFWFFFIFILILGAFSAGGYLAYTYLQQQSLESQSLVARNLARIEQQIAQLNDENSSLDKGQTNLQRALTAATQETESQLLSLAERLSATEAEGVGDWTLAEVEYLLRIANQRLVTSRDTATAVEMLQSADAILQELSYPELIPARRQLSEDIARLQLADSLDVEGIYFELESLAIEVERFDDFDPEYIEKPDAVMEEGDNVLANIWGKVSSVLSRYVRVDSSSDEPKYLVTEEQRVARLLTVQLQLRQAQLALLSSRQDIFSASLSSAAQAIDQFYGSSNTSNRGDAMSERLLELSDIELEIERMDINDSIRVLSDIVDKLARVEGS